MREVLPELTVWWRAGLTIGVATVVGTAAPGSPLCRCVHAGGPGPSRWWPAGQPVPVRCAISHDDAFTAGLTGRRPGRVCGEGVPGEPSTSSGRWLKTMKRGARSLWPL